MRDIQHGKLTFNLDDEGKVCAVTLRNNERICLTVPETCDEKSAVALSDLFAERDYADHTLRELAYEYQHGNIRSLSDLRRFLDKEMPRWIALTSYGDYEDLGMDIFAEKNGETGMPDATVPYGYTDWLEYLTDNLDFDKYDHFYHGHILYIKYWRGWHDE